MPNCWKSYAPAQLLIANVPVEQMKKHMSNNLYEAILLYALILKQMNLMNSGSFQCTCCTFLRIGQVTINLLKFAIRK